MITKRSALLGQFAEFERSTVEKGAATSTAAKRLLAVYASEHDGFMGRPTLTSVDERDADGDTPLMIAIYRNSPEEAAVWIGEGADVNAKCDGGLTPLHNATTHNNLEFLGLLLQSGANPLIPDNKGYTPIDLARALNDRDRLEILMRYVQK